MKSLQLLEALTCSRREDGLSCLNGVKPSTTHLISIMMGQVTQMMRVMMRADDTDDEGNIETIRSWV